MYNKQTIYDNPISLLNEVLEEYGYMKKIYDNPLSLLIHIFYSFGNGYSFIEKNNITLIAKDTLVYEESDKQTPNMIEIYNETKNTYEILLEKLNSDYFEKMLEDFNISIEDFNKLVDLTKADIVKLEEKINPTYLDNPPLKSINDLRNVDIDIDNVYWKNLTDIVCHYSLATRIPDNLAPKWKEVFDILTEKIISIDNEKVQIALNRGKKTSLDK